MHWLRKRKTYEFAKIIQKEKCTATQCMICSGVRIKELLIRRLDDGGGGWAFCAWDEGERERSDAECVKGVCMYTVVSILLQCGN